MAIKINIKELQGVVLSKFSDEKLKAASVVAAKTMDKIKNKETKEFKSPAIGGVWQKPYNANYAKKQGKGLNDVNLRANKPKRLKSIEKTNIKVIGKKAVLAFNDSRKGEIFELHQTGRAKGGKVRQIYPETNQEVPNEVLEAVKSFLIGGR